MQTNNLKFSKYYNVLKWDRKHQILLVIQPLSVAGMTQTGASCAQAGGALGARGQTALGVADTAQCSYSVKAQMISLC